MQQQRHRRIISPPARAEASIEPRRGVSLRLLWTTLTSGSINRRILGASLTVLFMTLAVKVAALFKEVLVAARFGTSDELDAFLIAYLIPSLIINVLGASLGSALIPTYVRIRENRSARDADRLAAELVLAVAALLAGAMLIVILSAPLYLPLLASGFSPAKRLLVQQLLWSLFPLVVISSVRALWGATLNAAERFGLMSFVPVITPASIAVLLVATPGLGIYNLVLGFTFGAIIETACLGAALWHQGAPLWARWRGYNEDLQKVFAEWLPMIAGALLMTSSTVVDQVMAATLASGSVSALEYGNRIVGVVTTLGGTALGVAVVPYFSQLAARQDWASVAHVVRRWLLLVAVVTVPAVVALTVWSEPIVRLGFQRGSFTVGDTLLVSRVQMFLALQIPFYIGGIMLVRLVSAMRENRALVWISLSNTVLNAILNLVFMRYLGLPGIGLATSVMYFTSFCWLWWYVSRRWGKAPA